MKISVKTVTKMYDIIIQIKAFFHYTLKHLFTTEFGLRAAIELLVLILSFYFACKLIIFIFIKIITGFLFIFNFINRKLIMPVYIRLIETIAYRFGNSNLQNKSEELKTTFNEKYNCKDGRNNKAKKRKFGWIFAVAYILVASYTICIHYLMVDRKEIYNAFFIPENKMVSLENYLVYTTFRTDEYQFACFYHGGDCLPIAFPHDDGKQPAYIATGGTIAPTTVIREEASVPGGATAFDADIDYEINPFADIYENDWYYEAVMFVYSNRLMLGADTKPLVFKPLERLTRDMIVTALYRVTFVFNNKKNAAEIIDMSEDNWHADAVKWAVLNELIPEYKNNKKLTEDTVTREELSILLYKYELITEKIPPDVRQSIKFSDAGAIGKSAREAVDKLTMQGIVGGDEENRYKPKDESIRADFAVMLMRYIQALNF